MASSLVERELLDLMLPEIDMSVAEFDAYLLAELRREPIVLHTPAAEVQVERRFPFLEAIGFVFTVEPEPQPGMIVIPDRRCPTCGQVKRHTTS